MQIPKGHPDDSTSEDFDLDDLDQQMEILGDYPLDRELVRGILLNHLLMKIAPPGLQRLF
jgi:hypothetical protein